MIIDIVLVYAVGRGGLEDVITKVSNSLAQKGYRVRVFQSYKPKNIEWEETLPEVHYYGQKQGLKQETIYSLSEGYREAVKKVGKPDVVLATHTPSLSFICRAALSYIGGMMPPIISWLHGPPEYFGNEHLLKYSDAHLAISTPIGESVQKAIQSDTPVYYVGNPVNLEDAKRVKRNSDQLKLIYIGRLHQHDKRLDVLFKGLEVLNKDWKLICIGEGPDEEELKSLSKQLDIDRNIEWLGWKEEPWEHVNDATALVLASDYEGFGLVLVEALSRGIPVISSRCSGPIDIIENDVNGWLFPIGDYNSLSKILKDIATGKKILPPQEICEQSVVKFNMDNVINNIDLIINYQYALEISNEEKAGISNYVVKERAHLDHGISEKVIKEATKGIQFIQTIQQETHIDGLEKYFTSQFIKESQVDFLNSKLEYSIRNLRLKIINYKLSQAIVEFILMQKENNLEESKEEFICEAKLINENGYWKIDELTLLNN